MLTAELANEELDREIRIEFFKSSVTGRNQNLGHISMTSTLLQNNVTEFYLSDKFGSSPNQIINFRDVRFNKRATFLEYIFGGCEIQLSIAIDLTLSNGDPNHPNSLHYFDSNKNEYLKVINSVGNILQYYDSDKHITALGFGARIPPNDKVASHCFALNGDIFSPDVDGLDGVVEAY